MKGRSRSYTWVLISVIFLALPDSTDAQQNNTLFFMHALPEANYVNPAVQIECGTFMGIPILSSTHVNIANSGFVGDKAVTLYTDGTVQRKPDMNTSLMMPRSYFLTEFHTVLLAYGVKKQDTYYNFTITEKNNTSLVYTKDLTDFATQGSRDFEGKSVRLKGARFGMNHVREFAFGISKKYSPALTLGIRFKLLFGIFNFSMAKSNIELRIQETTRDLEFSLDGGYNSSLPYALVETAPDEYAFEEAYDKPIMNHLLNFRNPGVALDFGFIYRYNSQWTFSGSLLDAGFIFYRSNLSNYSINGDFTYTGPLAEQQITDDYLWHLFNEWNRNADETLSADPYFYMLDPRLYLGASRKLNNSWDINFLLYNRFLPSKIQTGATVSLTSSVNKPLRTSVSWSFMNYSPVNLGLGLSYGRRPLQVYFVSDNILGFIWPLYTKNVNLRAGINLNLGCKSTFNADQCGCDWLKAEQQRRSRKEKLRRGRKA